MTGAPTHADADLAEADRLMTICNACRYCEGLCAVFPAMEMRRVFGDADLNYLANLCHDCGACLDDCQFAPPHEFAVDVPRALARVRARSYERHAWPAAFSVLFVRNEVKTGIAAVLAAALLALVLLFTKGPSPMFDRHSGPGAFYALMPHGAMVATFGAALLYGLLALTMSARKFWRETGEPARARVEAAAFGQATVDAARLRYLDGGGMGCAKEGERDRRAFFHHLTFYGFILCFAATAVATLEHFLLGRVAPYPWYDLPVLLGSAGGLGLLIGPAGLLAAKGRRDPQAAKERRFGMDVAFTVMLFATSLTGFALLLLRDSGAMGSLLALHLGLVLALFLSLPYGKFVHGIYRYLALARYAQERREAARH